MASRAAHREDDGEQSIDHAVRCEYDHERKQLSVQERGARLVSFKQTLDGLLTECDRSGDKDPRFRSQVLREFGTLEWYRSHPAKARAYWRQALKLDPKNSLASAWLNETQGAVFNQ